MAKIPDKTDIARTYKPAPLDLSDIRLPESLSELTEVIAANTHEVWSQRRMAEGWTYGPVRDEKALRHPCLLPYAELSENERDYDRATAMNAIKMMVKLGFKIEKCE
ncbi:MAG: Ryanodine receptor Ryr [Bacteroidales bacterium]|nr:Ryanodine receptor Ryr [Bacteroidales bacterium]